MVNPSNGKQIPELEISQLTEILRDRYSILISNSQILSFSPILESWTSLASNKSLSYYTHGIFRYFGKFPPPVARHLIQKYTKSRDLVLDPMCGSGTTALECLLLNRKSKCYDINPLAILISKVKITRVNRDIALKALEDVCDVAKNIKETSYIPVGLKNYTHWFLPETISSLSKIKQAIEESNAPENIKELLFLSFLAIVRRVSRATTQQGRLFLDVETAEENALPFFYKKALEAINSSSMIPNNGLGIEINQKSILSKGLMYSKAKLIICHPPYFNAYKYSGVNSLELSWMGIDHAQIRKGEIREAFKVGKPEKIEDYLKDMEEALINMKDQLDKDGVLALMIGDTVLRGKYIPVTKMLLERLKKVYKIDQAALRIPQFTEASWAASQRRNGQQVGVNLCDLIVILKPI